MPDGSTHPTLTSTVAPSGPYTAPGFSIEMLGRQLALAERKHHHLNIVRVRVGNEEPPDEMDARRLEQRRVKRAEEAVGHHLTALQDLIMTSRPVTMQDTVVQLLVGGVYLERCTQPGENGEAAQVVMERMLEGVTRCIAQHAGLSISDVGGSYYASVASELWPDVDTTEVVSDMDCWDVSIDGSGPSR